MLQQVNAPPNAIFHREYRTLRRVFVNLNDCKGLCRALLTDETHERRTIFGRSNLRVVVGALGCGSRSMSRP